MCLCGSILAGPIAVNVMNASRKSDGRRACGSVSGRKSKKRQIGAEMVEFIVMLLFFFIVLFIIIDFAILVFNKGTLIEASRIGARQGSLFWIDPSNYDMDPTDALAVRRNIRMKEAMIVTAVDYYRDHILMKFASDTGTIGPDVYFQGMPSTDVSGSYPTRTFRDVSPYPVGVDLCYPHHDLGVLSLLNFTNTSGCTSGNPTPSAPAPRQFILEVRTGLSTESRF